MPRCILCLADKPLTEEHIVPDCVGGSLKKYLLCKDCNSNLGSTVDGPFSNSFLVQLPRHAMGIGGKKDKVPNAFGAYGEVTHQGRSMDVRMDEDGRPYVKPIVAERVEGDGLAIELLLDKSDESMLDKILEKKISRYYREQGMAEDEIAKIVEKAKLDAKEYAQATSHQPTINFRRAIDMRVHILEAIKIAYEIAVLEFGENYYLNSPVAAQLRTALFCANPCETKGGLGVPLDAIGGLLPDAKSHYVLLLDNSCIVSIFGFKAVVEYCWSRETFCRSPEDAVLYLFDPVGRTHERKLLVEHIFQSGGR